MRLFSLPAHDIVTSACPFLVSERILGAWIKSRPSECRVGNAQLPPGAPTFGGFFSIHGHFLPYPPFLSPQPQIRQTGPGQVLPPVLLVKAWLTFVFLMPSLSFLQPETMGRGAADLQWSHQMAMSPLSSPEAPHPPCQCPASCSRCQASLLTLTGSPGAISGMWGVQLRFSQQKFHIFVRTEHMWCWPKQSNFPHF